MSADHSASTLARATLFSGAVAAVLDITGAIVQVLIKGGPPVRVLQSIASGVQGREAYTGGTASAVLGGAIHLGIATAMAAAFVLVAARWTVLVRRPLVFGPLYGVAMWAVMYLGVLPARWPERFPRFDAVDTTTQLAFHVFLVGLPIAMVAARVLGYSANSRSTTAQPGRA